ncbi:hypothetical protein [Lysinibacillus sp. RS5]|uniref:hypothetical protein n=1 Tax=unclassified Lysinibacillus TaxID=2636778 RepID=UPI0035BE23A9
MDGKIEAADRRAGVKDKAIEATDRRAEVTDRKRSDGYEVTNKQSKAMDRKAE